MAEVNEKDMLEGIGGLGILVHQLAKLAGRGMLTPTPMDSYTMELRENLSGAELQADIIANWILKNANEMITEGGCADVAIRIFEEWKRLKDGEGVPDWEAELPPGGTVLNPVEREALEKTLNEARETVQELYTVIAPLKDLGFDLLNMMGKHLAESQAENYRKLGEVVDRVNEYFHGR